MTSAEHPGIVVWSERKARLPMKPFAPAIALMNRLTYPQKFLLISLLFILPLVLVMYLLLSELSLQREFSQKELLQISILSI
jgi:phosphoserine phosphatase RsbU/P